MIKQNFCIGVNNQRSHCVVSGGVVDGTAKGPGFNTSSFQMFSSPLVWLKTDIQPFFVFIKNYRKVKQMHCVFFNF